MHFLRDLSFRYKIPLRGVVLVLATASLLTASLIYREYRELKADVVSTAASMSRVLANTLVAPLTHDDVWRAYEIINSPFSTSSEGNPKIAEFVVVLDRHNRIYIATQPADYPMLGDPGRINPDFNRMQAMLPGVKEFETRVVDLADSETIYMLTPIMSDGVLLGTLVMGYSKHAFVPRFLEIFRSGAIVSLLVIAIVIPASWVWAQRFARPLVNLADVMGKVGTTIPDDSEIEVEVEESGDEIGRLAKAFAAMLGELREKQAMEGQMVLSERLAAVGRLSAAIAHEINNPLGGMLNAISTFKRHGNDDPLTLHTLALIEGGLQQISETVSALLVEATHRSHPLGRQDIEDIRTLVLPDAHAKEADLVWQNLFDEVVAVPATPIRQILLNLLLNALQAVFKGGTVFCRVGCEDGQLKIVVGNDGQFIAREAMEALFEPLPSSREGSHGLGLWVTYQLVQQLGGEITAESEPGETRFTVTLPLKHND
jgi:two-component system, NtrC family, sensor kinase